MSLADIEILSCIYPRWGALPAVEVYLETGPKLPTLPFVSEPSMLCESRIWNNLSSAFLIPLIYKTLICKQVCWAVTYETQWVFRARYCDECYEERYVEITIYPYFVNDVRFITLPKALPAVSPQNCEKMTRGTGLRYFQKFVCARS